MDGKLQTSLCPTDCRVKAQTVIAANCASTKAQLKIKKELRKATQARNREWMGYREGRNIRRESIFSVCVLQVSISYLTFQLQLIYEEGKQS